VKIGLASPNSDYGVAPAEMARDLEQRGYDSLWVGEHSHIPASRETPHPAGIDLPKMYSHMRDPFVSLAVAASATTTLELVTGVCLVLEHEILDLTKTVATLDELSGGRLRLGVGVGWNREELANVSPVPWGQRYNAMRETVAAMRALWGSDEAGYDGDHVQVAPSWVWPKPTKPTGPPVLMGCQGRVGLRHAAEYADEWCPLDVGFRDVGKGLQWFRDAVVAADRDPDTIPISMYCFGQPDAATIERFADLGIHRVVFSAPDEADRHHSFLDRYQGLVDRYATRS
jgi:probable F420-dependent oxidoreductase